MKLDCIVIGSGISGLSAAWKIQQLGKKVLVLESADKIGGCIESVKTNNFIQEFGAHSGFNSYNYFLSILSKLKQKPQIIPKKNLKFVVLQNQKISSVLSKINILQLLVSIVKTPFVNKENKTVQEYYSLILGKDNYNNIIKHALNAVSSQIVDDMPASFLFQKRPKDKTIVRKFSFSGGMIEPLENIAQELEIKLNSKVDSLERDNGFWHIKSRDRLWQSKKIIIATPPYIAAELLKTVLPELSDSLVKIKPAFIESSMVVDVNSRLELCAGIIGVNEKIYSMISSDPVNQEANFNNETKRGFTAHFKPNLFTEKQKKNWFVDSILADDNSTISIKNKLNSLPQISFDHYDKIKLVSANLSSNIGLCGNYFQGISIEDCVQRSDAEVSRLFDT